MATSGKTDGGVFTGVEWSSSPVTFHENKGKNVRLTEGNKVASRVISYNFGIVFTAEPLRVGQLLKVTVTKRAESEWGAGLRVGFTGEDPTNSTLTECSNLLWQKDHKDILYNWSTTLRYNDKELCKLGFDTIDFTPSQSLGLLLTRDRECHWFLDNKWRGSVQMRDFPLDQPMWGVVDVYGRCKQAEADICTVSKHPSDSEMRLMEMGLILPSLALVQRLLGVQAELEQQLSQAQSDKQQLQQALTQERERSAAEIQQLTQQLQRTDAENERLMAATLRGQVGGEAILQTTGDCFVEEGRSQDSEEDSDEAIAH